MEIIKTASGFAFFHKTKIQNAVIGLDLNLKYRKPLLYSKQEQAVSNLSILPSAPTNNASFGKQVYLFTFFAIYPKIKSPINY